MQRAISLLGTVLVLMCIFLVLVAVPAGALDDFVKKPDFGKKFDDGKKPPVDGQYKPPVDDQYKPIKPGHPKGPIDTPKGVKPDTIVGKKVPVTGGPPLIVLAA